MVAAEPVLKLDELRLPEAPRVELLQVDEYTDSTGDPALRVLVVLEDLAEDAEPRWSQLKPIQDEVFRVLAAKGESRFPYVSFRTVSEL